MNGMGATLKRGRMDGIDADHAGDECEDTAIGCVGH
jgi:hypothetical protein